MTITNQSILRRVVDTLVDPTSVRWFMAELCRYFNDGKREVVKHRPDASSELTAIPLVAGVRQAIPATAAKLLGIGFNTSGGLPITLVDLRMLDACEPGWRALAGSAVIKHYGYDERNPTVFDVYPPAAQGASVQADLSMLPEDIDIPDDDTTFEAVTGTFDLPDIYANSLHDYVCFRAFSKESEVAVSGPRALSFLGYFADGLGVELRSLLITSPRMAEAAARARAQAQVAKL